MILCPLSSISHFAVDATSSRRVTVIDHPAFLSLAADIHHSKIAQNPALSVQRMLEFGKCSREL
jgi:hypothetical protein